MKGSSRRSRSALQEGAIIGVPTDTVYGLAARWDRAAGVRGLFVAKGRAEEQTVAALFASVDEVERALPDLDPTAARVMRALLPGPYTFVVKTEVPRAPLVGTADSLGVRVPDARRSAQTDCVTGHPPRATSANLTGERDAATLEDVDPSGTGALLGRVRRASPAAASDGADVATGAATAAGAASTVVDLRPLSTRGSPVVLRDGAVPEMDVLERIAELT